MAIIMSPELPQGLVTINSYQKLLSSPIFSEIELYSDNFLEKFSEPLEKFARKWVADSLHQWSRQWEYAYTYTEITSQASAQKKRLRVLDAGSGISFFPFFVSESSICREITCCDMDSSLAEAYSKVSSKLQKSINFISKDLGNTGFDDNSYDVIYCISVLEHTNNFSQIIDEFSRLLTNEGILI